MPAWRMHTRRPFFIFVLAALFIYTFDNLVIRNPSLQHQPGSDWVLSAAVMIDFIVIVPLLFYWLVARRQSKTVLTAAAPLAKVMPWAALGAVIAWLSLHNRMQVSLWTVELILLPVEALFIGWELRSAISVYRKLRKQQQTESGQPLPEALAAVLGPGKLKAYIRHDVSVLYYLLGSWKAVVPKSRPGEQVFTYHRTTGLFVTFALLTKVLLFEAVVVHLFVRMWSETLAWIATFGTVWLIALIWADCRRSALEPVRLTGSSVKIRHGLRLQADVPYSLIASVQTGIELKPSKQQRRDSAEPMLGTANVCIVLREPFIVEGLLFQPRQVTFIYLTLDEPEAFAGACSNLNQIQ
ncbi:hypothetical protein [Paenibacillus kobensis]|uniref:hypothetical protein n=1 Tax=Paenibacillus kobensis TaxID=59841 RepID=UPI000FD86A5F|nr:hypothetical protein [Paenibacillus kobensis]